MKSTSPTWTTPGSFYEKGTAFRAGCRPIAPHSCFYDLDELKRCYAIA